MKNLLERSRSTSRQFIPRPGILQLQVCRIRRASSLFGDVGQPEWETRGYRVPVQNEDRDWKTWRAMCVGGGLIGAAAPTTTPQRSPPPAHVEKQELPIRSACAGGGERCG